MWYVACYLWVEVAGLVVGLTLRDDPVRRFATFILLALVVPAALIATATAL